MPTHLAAPRTFQDISQPGCVVGASHPDRLAAIASFFGMEPQPVDNCRVLEIGCWFGRNLLPMAERLPESHFVGIDPSADRIAKAQQTARQVELANVEFHVADLEGIDHQLGTFDYVICHDVFSRAAPQMQHALLSQCRALLNPQGVAYVSFRTLPGAIVPEILRDAVQQRTPPDAPTANRIAEARNVLEFIAASLPAGAAGYRRLLRNDAEFALQLNDAAVAHEYLGDQSHPAYFHEFVELAVAHRLQYVGDANIHTMFAATLGREIESRLMQVVRDGTSLEQVMDLLRNRSFHRSLLCRDDVAVSCRWSPDRLNGLYLAGCLYQRGDDSLASTTTVRFAAADGSSIASASPAVKVALATIGQRWPQAIAFDQLVAEVGGRLGDGNAETNTGLPDADRDVLGKNLIECIANGLVEPRTASDRFVVAASDRPTVSRLARAEAESRPEVTNRLHEPVPLDEMSHSLLQYLDGKHDRAALLGVVQDAAKSGRLSILRDGIPAGEDTLDGQILEQALDQTLTRLGQSALLVA